MGRLLVLLLFCGGIALVGGAIWIAMSPTQAFDKTSIAVEGVEAGVVPVATVEAPTQVVIRNNSKKDIRFVGGNFGCQMAGCIRLVGDCPVTVPAGSELVVPVLISIRSPGPFKLDLLLYLDVDGVALERTAVITGTGDAVSDK